MSTKDKETVVLQHLLTGFIIVLYNEGTAVNEHPFACSKDMETVVTQHPITRSCQKRKKRLELK